MPEEGFLRRWARVKATGADAAPEPPPAPAPAPVPPVSPWARAGDVGPGDAPVPAPAPAGERAGQAGPPAPPAPTLDDVARLTPDSDYSIFVGQGVDKSVQRQALKKLFADPHFNVLDRLDMYMDDYNKPSPVSAAMLASLDHARSALRRVVEEDPAVATHVDAAGGETAAPAGRHDAPAHNEAAHAAAHDAPPARDAACIAHLPDAGLSDSPNPQLSQGQA